MSKIIKVLSLGLFFSLASAALGARNAREEVQEYLNNFLNNTLKIQGKTLDQLIIEDFQRLTPEQRKRMFPGLVKDQMGLLQNYLETVIIPQNAEWRKPKLRDAMNQAMSDYLSKK